MNTYIKDFIGLWQHLPKHNGLPLLSSVSLQVLHDYKDAFFILERTDPESVVVRQCGQYFSAAYNCDMRSKNLIEYYKGKNKVKLQKILGNVFDQRCGAINTRPGFLATGASVTLRSVTLPLVNIDAHCAYAVGIIEFIRSGGQSYLSPGGKISPSYSVAPKLIDVGFGISGNVVAT